ncbi:MAG: transglutaminaseTgpA domain-containing protein [Streptosporangiaceae bacterium]
MSYRLTVISAISVVLASVSLFSVINGAGWLLAGIGAAATMAVAGTLTRLAPVPSAVAATVLALLAAVPLVLSGHWYGIAVAAVMLAVTAASGTGQRLARAVATSVTYLTALLAYLTLVFARAHAAAWVVPTPASMRYLEHLIGQAMTESHYAPPVPAEPGLLLVAAGGIGLIAAAADLIAVRLRSPAIAGLPLLVLFSVPIATSVKQTGTGEAVAFCIAVTGFLALLAADSRDRLRLWGRLVTVWGRGVSQDEQGPDTRALSASGRRVGAAAVGLAVLVPLLLPGLHVHSLFHRDTSAGPGTAGAQLPDPLVRMDSQLRQGKPRPVLRYRPLRGSQATGQYLQVYVLNYDSASQSWVLVAPRSPGRAVFGQRLLASAPGLLPPTPTQTVRLQISLGQVSGYASSFLPLPYAAERLQVPGTWREDPQTLMVYSEQPLSGLRYTVTSAVAGPSDSDLDGALALAPAGQLRADTSYNGPDRAELLKIAYKITKHAQTPYAKALALQDWFLRTGHFTYTLHPDLPSSSAGLVDFLTRQRAGFCQQFAFAMATLARLLGIPARVAIGYTGGTRQPDGRWLVTTGDAHAWPELYFDGIGWLRFEPTPGGAAGQGTATPPAYASGSAIAQQAGTGPATAPSDTSPAKSNPGESGTGTKLGGHRGLRITGPVSAGAAAQARSSFPVALVVVIALALACLLPGAVRWMSRRRRWAAARTDAGLAHAAWRELRADLADYRVAVRVSDSPRALAARVAADCGLDKAATAALRRIAFAEERARYAAAPGPASGLRADVTVVRRALAQHASRRVRWLARLLPASVLGPAGQGLRQSLDMFGWLDAIRIRRRTGRRGGLLRRAD